MIMTELQELKSKLKEAVNAQNKIEKEVRRKMMDIVEDERKATQIANENHRKKYNFEILMVDGTVITIDQLKNGELTDKNLVDGKFLKVTDINNSESAKLLNVSNILSITQVFA